MPHGSLTTRTGRPDDYAVFVRLFHEIDADHAPPSPERWNEKLAAQTLFVELDGAPIALAQTTLFEDRAHVHLVAVAPEHRQRGVGRFLMQEVERTIARAKLPCFILNVWQQNRAAIQLYESVGMTRIGTSAGLRLSWSALRGKTDSAWPIVEPLAPDRDRDVEGRFQLPAGGLHVLRMAGAHVVAAFSPDGSAEGLAVREWVWREVHPFRVTRSELLVPLLLAVDDGKDDRVVVFVNDDPETESFAASLGAEVVHRGYRYLRNVQP